jgi:hypothetical protein
LKKEKVAGFPEFMILKENQSGFRQSYSTLDNIYFIFTLFQILKSKKKKLYCAFIDFEKAFDRNLAFSIGVNSFPKQLTIVIGL